VCRSCGAILDREKVALYGFVQRDRKSAMEPQRQGEKRDKEAGK
jgi:hypothetical protein